MWGKFDDPENEMCFVKVPSCGLFQSSKYTTSNPPIMSSAWIPNSFSFWAIWGNWSSWGGARFVPSLAPPSETQPVTDGQSINFNLPAIRPNTPSQIPYTCTPRCRILPQRRCKIANALLHVTIPYHLDKYSFSRRNELPHSCHRKVTLCALPPMYNYPVTKLQLVNTL